MEQPSHYQVPVGYAGRYPATPGFKKFESSTSLKTEEQKKSSEQLQCHSR